MATAGLSSSAILTDGTKCKIRFESLARLGKTGNQNDSMGRKAANQHGLRVTPDKDPSDSTTIVIAHGARKSMSSLLISFFHVEMARRGFFTVKFNFPYMEAKFRLTRTPNPKRSPRGMLSKSPRRSHVAPETGEPGHRRTVDGSGSRIPCCGRQ